MIKYNFTDFLRDKMTRAKEGYKSDAIALIKMTARHLETSEKIDPQIREYLISALTYTLKTGDANKGFHLKVGRGKQKKDTLLRDYQAAKALERKKQEKDYNHDRALKEVAAEINKDFNDSIDVKTIETAYTKFKPLIDEDNNPTNSTP